MSETEQGVVENPEDAEVTDDQPGQAQTAVEDENTGEDVDNDVVEEETEDS